MGCSKFHVVTLLGVGIFLAGVACLVAVAIHNALPAREEQNFKEINCTIASGGMDAKAKCSPPHNKHDEASYPCLRIYVLCGNDAKRNGSLDGLGQPRLLLKDFHSLHEQVETV